MQRWWSGCWSLRNDQLWRWTYSNFVNLKMNLPRHNSSVFKSSLHMIESGIKLMWEISRVFPSAFRVYYMFIVITGLHIPVPRLLSGYWVIIPRSRFTHLPIQISPVNVKSDDQARGHQDVLHGDDYRKLPRAPLPVDHAASLSIHPPLVHQCYERPAGARRGF